MNGTDQIERARTTWGRLTANWESTLVLWDDPVRHHFEQYFWDQLRGEFREAIHELEHLDNTMERVRDRLRNLGL